jgi:hypothetical protein
VAQGLALFYGAASLAFPKLRVDSFINAGIAEVFVADDPEFWLFALPLTISLVLGVFSGLLMLRRRPDPAESVRLVAFRDRCSVHGLGRGPAAHDRAGGDLDRAC